MCRFGAAAFGLHEGRRCGYSVGMLGFTVGKVSFDALILCLTLYLVARHEADYDFQKLTMVVAGTALGNLLLFVGLSMYLPPRHVMWVAPIVQVVFSGFMIKTFCWVSFWKALMVAAICTALHVGFGLTMDWVMRRMMGGKDAAPSLVEKRDRELEETRAEMEHMLAQSAEALAAVPEAAVTNHASATNAPDLAPSVTNPPAGTNRISAPASVSTNGPIPPVEATPVPSGTEDEWVAARKLLKISGTSGRPGAYVALVNQRVVNVGDTVSVRFGNRTFRWTVREISRDRVELQPRDVR